MALCEPSVSLAGPCMEPRVVRKLLPVLLLELDSSAFSVQWNLVGPPEIFVPSEIRMSQHR